MKYAKGKAIGVRAFNGAGGVKRLNTANKLAVKKFKTKPAKAKW